MHPRRTRAALGATALLAGTTLLAPAAPAVPPVDGMPPLEEDRVLLPLPDSLHEQGLGDLQLTAPYHSEAGPLRAGWGAPGPHPVTRTTTVHDCASVFYRLYNVALRYTQGTNEASPCIGTFRGENAPIGTQMIYPADISEAQAPAPLIVLSPGISTEPGMLTRQADLYASHGYVVALGYSFLNWFGYQVELATSRALEENADPDSPLHGRIDTSRTVLVGHSAGGGSVARVASTLQPAVREADDPDFTVRGVAAVNPGPGEFGLTTPPSDVPQLFLVAARESLVPHKLSRVLYDRATGPKWWAEVPDSYHGTFLDDPATNVYGALVLSFAAYVLDHGAAAVDVYEGPGLAADPEVDKVERVLP